MINWAKPIQTRHRTPRFGLLLPGNGPRGQRRVCIAGDGKAFAGQNDARAYTTWFYNDDGTPSGDAHPDWVLDNAA